MRHLCALIVALALCAPASALAQSAGDDQYLDPFAGSTPTATAKTHAAATATPTAPPLSSTPPTSSATAAPTAAPTVAATVAPARRTAPTAARGLPNTGAEPGLAGLLGFGLLLAGFGLRLGLRVHARRLH